MNLYEVWVWARRHGVAGARFRALYKQAFLVTVSGLLRAIHREGLAPASSIHADADGHCNLCIGLGPSLLMPLTVRLPLHPLHRIDAADFPSLKQGKALLPLPTTRIFLRALTRVLEGSESMASLEQIQADFDNSFANLVLNHVLFAIHEPASSAVEPAFQGHNIYPFPALRRGPSLDLVSRCSHLSSGQVGLTLVGVRAAKFISVAFPCHHACTREWSGMSLQNESMMFFPVHPWQMEISPVIHRLRDLGMISIADTPIAALPLASQRTCRIVSTGFDVKLPVNATLTGEHRLLYPANVQNAPVVSALIQALHAQTGEKTIDFQYDVAALVHPDMRLATHLSAIIRSPVPEYADEQVVPAINLWLGRQEAHRLLKMDNREDAYEVFAAYCTVLMRGPIGFYTQFGMAFEPHLQNTLIRIRNGRPTGVVMRDLDSTILDAERVPSFFREHDLALPVDVWPAMPALSAGGQRLTHALLHGHLSMVMSHLIKNAEADPVTLNDILLQTWGDILSDTPASLRHLVINLRDQADTVKCLLRMRLEKSVGLVFRQHKREQINGCA